MIVLLISLTTVVAADSSSLKATNNLAGLHSPLFPIHLAENEFSHLLALQEDAPLFEARKKNDKSKKEKEEKKKRKNRRTKLKRVKNLGFDTAIANYRQRLVTLPSSDNAAVFEATGEAWGVVTISVVQNRIELVKRRKKGKGDPIIVNKFRTGGSLARNGRGVLDRFGYLSDIRIGAQANISAKSPPGKYRGRATVRLTYR